MATRPGVLDKGFKLWDVTWFTYRARKDPPRMMKREGAWGICDNNISCPKENSCPHSHYKFSSTAQLMPNTYFNTYEIIGIRCSSALVRKDPRCVPFSSTEDTYLVVVRSRATQCGSDSLVLSPQHSPSSGRMSLLLLRSVAFRDESTKRSLWHLMTLVLGMPLVWIGKFQQARFLVYADRSKTCFILFQNVSIPTRFAYYHTVPNPI